MTAILTGLRALEYMFTCIHSLPLPRNVVRVIHVSSTVLQKFLHFPEAVATK